MSKKIVLLIVSVFIALSYSQECIYSDLEEDSSQSGFRKETGNPKECPPFWISRKVFVKSSNTTFAKLLDEDGGEAMSAAQGIAEELYKYRDVRLDQKEEIRWLRHTEGLKGERNSANDKKKVLGFGCIGLEAARMEDFEGETKTIEVKEGIVSERTHKMQAMRSEELYNNVFKFEKFIRENTASAISGYGLGWDKIFSMNFYQYSEEDDFFSCDVADVLAYYIQGEWSIAASITNSSVYKEVDDPERIHFTEFLTFSKSNNSLPIMKPEPKTINLKTCETEPPFTEINTKGTAAYETYEGKTQPSHFATKLWEDNLAIQKALDRGNLQKELVRDATSISNAAILIVPAFLAFLPISLFHEVGLGMALLYAAVTDIISVTPLLIKGIELIHFGKQKQWATQSQVYGLNGKDEDGIVELWTARCTMNQRITRIGIAFLATAICITVIGILLEVGFSFLLHREKSAWDEAEQKLKAADEKSYARKNNAGLIWYWNNKQHRDVKVIA